MPTAALRARKDELFGDGVAAAHALEQVVDVLSELLVMDDVDHPLANELVAGHAGREFRGLGGGTIYVDEVPVRVVEQHVIRDRVEQMIVLMSVAGCSLPSYYVRPSDLDGSPTPAVRATDLVPVKLRSDSYRVVAEPQRADSRLVVLRPQGAGSDAADGARSRPSDAEGL